ncbi:MAG: phospholipid/cholesterol/gamma-HCH transport system substrate-binding protein, partial [Nocardioidaceae bacterium]|nr:phospholipid/cholesterol/gamma-HCH transport system substrate-binding protein [Nocardioidaceae bacterium]
LALLSDTLVDADPDLRRLFAKGSVSARTLREVVNENEVNLGNAVRDLVTANKPLKENVLGLQAIFILYPYLVEGSYGVLQPIQEDGKTQYNANFGAVITDTTATCTYAQNGGVASGYRERRDESIISDREFGTGVDCNVKPNHIARQASKTVLKRVAAESGATADGKDSWKWLLLDPAGL